MMDEAGLGALLGQDGKGHPLGVRRLDHVERGGHQMPVDPHVWRGADLHVQVGPTVLHGELEQLVQI